MTKFTDEERRKLQAANRHIGDALLGRPRPASKVAPITAIKFRGYAIEAVECLGGASYFARITKPGESWITEPCKTRVHAIARAKQIIASKRT